MRWKCDDSFTLSNPYLENLQGNSVRATIGKGFVAGYVASSVTCIAGMAASKFWQPWISVPGHIAAWSGASGMVGCLLAEKNYIYFIS